MPKVNSSRHEPWQMVPQLRLPRGNHGDQGRELKAEEDTMKETRPTFPPGFAQEPIRREPPKEIEHDERGDDGRDDRHADEMLSAVVSRANEVPNSVAAVYDR